MKSKFDIERRVSRGALRPFFLGFVRLHILHHAAHHRISGAWIREELRNHGYDLSPGTLYPILHDLEHRGLLRSFHRVKGGRVRRCYEITEEGRRFLEDAKVRLRHLVCEILGDEVSPQKGGLP